MPFLEFGGRERNPFNVNACSAGGTKLVILGAGSELVARQGLLIREGDLGGVRIDECRSVL